MKTVNLTDGTWKQAKRAALDAEVPLRAWVEQAVVLALEHGIVWGVAALAQAPECVTDGTAGTTASTRGPDRPSNSGAPAMAADHSHAWDDYQPSTRSYTCACGAVLSEYGTAMEAK